MLDPPRPEAIAAVQRCQEAGIVKDDYRGPPVTARAIAQQIGLHGGSKLEAPNAISGRELERASNEQLSIIAEDWQFLPE